MLLTSLIAAPAFSQQDMTDPFKIGDTVDIAPQKDVHGGTIDIKKFRGKKVVVLAFWLNSCNLCMEQIKLLNDNIKKRNLDKKDALITVIRADADDKDITLDLLHENKLSLPVMLDPVLNIARKFRVTEVPAFILIDKNGRLASEQVHYVKKPIRDTSLIEMIDILTAGKSIPPVAFVPYTNDAKLKNMIGKQAPEFQLGSLDGRTYSLDEYRKKTNVVLLFWHPYSIESQTMIRLLTSFYSPENRAKYNFEILAVSSIFGQSQMDECRKLFDEVHPGFSFLYDTDSKVGDDYGVKSIPAIFVIDKNGVIADVVMNDVTNIGVEKRLSSVLDSLK
jgi:peroxiredoxin